MSDRLPRCRSAVTTADTVARSLGMPDDPRAVIPHDHLSEDTAAIAKRLEPLLEEILDRLLAR
ncbi:MAG: hypothetical protein OXT07_09465 [bacterium]|nr:hypothetical protein [bacterium]MDE0216595.1 hypothetical protein [bacterium]